VPVLTRCLRGMR